MKKVTLLEKEYEIIKDEHNCFDLQEVEGLITDYFEPYDYILGDYSYGKLILKGYYDSKSKKKNKVNDYSNIDTYIKEYCSFNCKHFILKKEKV